MFRSGSAILALVVAGPLAGQVDAPRPSVSLVAGATTYDLSGTGSAFAAGAFMDYPVASFLRIEGGTGFVRYRRQGGTNAGLLFPEAGLRLTGTIGNVQPFVGAGAGAALTLEGGGPAEFTLHGVMGVRFLAGPGISLRGELRLRSVDPFAGTTADFMGGLSIGL